MKNKIDINYDEIKNTNDSELIMLYRENDEDAKNILYFKYKFIIDIILNKYMKDIIKYNIDYQEIYSECSLGFSDGLKSYQDNRNTGLPTFLTICVERRLKSVLRKYKTDKYRSYLDTFSLDFLYEDNSINLLDFIEDDEYEPLKKITEKESLEELLKRINTILTSQEQEVFVLMANGLNYQEIAKILNKTPKQVDNTRERVKNKIKKYIIKESEKEA